MTEVATDLHGIPANCARCGEQHVQTDIDRYVRLAVELGYDPSVRGRKGILCSVCLWRAIDRIRAEGGR